MDVTRIQETVERLGGRTAARLPEPFRLAIAGRAPARVDGHTLDAQLRTTLALRRLRGVPPLDALTPAEARALVGREARAGAPPPPRVGGVTELTLDGAAGPLRARHYRPLPEAPPEAGDLAPLVVFVHGGGFVTCNLDTHDAPCRLLCRHAGAHVLSVEYRLAPEHPFPAAVDDVRAALRAARAQAGELGADPGRVAVVGDSAGGNLATVVSRLMTRAGERPPDVQVLIYPATDRIGRHRSTELFADGCYLTAADIAWYNEQYVGPSGDASHPDVSPLLEPDLSGLPPALVVTAGFDPLRDEGEAYAAALRAAGTPAVLRRFPSLPHAFANMTGLSRAAHDAVVETAGGLRAMLGRLTRP